MGFIKNPSKSIIDPVKTVKSNIKKTYKQLNNNEKENYDKNKLMILCSIGFIGIGGLHDFYLRNIGKGIIKFFTMDWFLIGTVIDLIKIYNNSYI